MKKASLIIFVFVAVAELIAVTFNMPLIQTLAKPLIMIALTGYYISGVDERNYFFVAALVFCWLGDVLLMFQGDELFFIAGLVAFLSGHVLYMVSYRQMRNPQDSDGLLNTQKIRFAFPIVLAGTGLVVVLLPHLGSLKIPVMVYALVLTVMVLQALFRFGFTSKRSFTLVFVGAIFFMISDSALAINKFMQPLPMSSLLIMSTYLTAQFLIVEGAIQHSKNSNDRKS
jgi:uncharacterized membrane protein YhhN